MDGHQNLENSSKMSVAPKEDTKAERAGETKPRMHASAKPVGTAGPVGPEKQAHSVRSPSAYLF